MSPLGRCLLEPMAVVGAEDALGVGRIAGRAERRGLPALSEAVALAVHLQDVDTVCEPVQQSAGEPLKVESGGPILLPSLSGPAEQESLYLPGGEERDGLLLHPDRLSRPENQRRAAMTAKKVFVSYDHEGDMLEVLWAFREGHFTPTDDERVLKRLDDDGEVIGFLIHEMSTITDPSPIEFELAPEAPADDVANVTVKEAANGLGVSERRVRKLARDGRVRGATKAGGEWLIPTPVDVIPGRRGPAGVAGRVEHSGG